MLKDFGKDIPKLYKRVLVTGGAGFIGSHLCEKLLSLGVKTYSIDDFSTGKRENIKSFLKNKKFTNIECDITDFPKLESYFKKYRFEAVFHQAASKKTICLRDPKRDLEVNGKGTLGLLQTAQKYKVKKFVHASTGSVYGELQTKVQDENHPLSPTSYYGVSKLAGERYAILFHKLYDLDTTVLRYFHVYGPRQEFSPYGGVVAIFMRNCLKNENPTIFGTGKQERSFTFVRDVVNANLLVASRPKTKGEVYNCASGIHVTIKQLLDEINNHFRDKTKQFKIIYDDWVPGDIKEFNIDNRKIKKLGLTFVTNMSPGLSEVYESMKTSLSNVKK
ncbi:MAG: NAD-dependent epimerase/dehydratase family protein [Patescibacteria group bacterium]|jgi:UDP-glucose 4-epimerase